MRIRNLCGAALVLILGCVQTDGQFNATGNGSGLGRVIVVPPSISTPDSGLPNLDGGAGCPCGDPLCGPNPQCEADAGFFGDGGACFLPPSDAGPDTEPIVSSTPAPPPISGGNLLMAKDGITAVVADPDRDQLVFVNLTTAAVMGTVVLNAGDEPGRLVEDAHQRVHVALRRGGAVVTVDIASRAVVDRTAVCPEPRGIAFESVMDQIHIACTDGELVTLPAAGGSVARRVQLPGDLRDVVVASDDIDAGTVPQLWVTQFRSAQVWVVDAQGNVVRDAGVSPSPTSTCLLPATPGVAWRAVPLPHGWLAMLHEVANTTVNLCQSNPYGGSGGLGCGGGFPDSGLTFPDGGSPSDGGFVVPPPASGGSVVASALSVLRPSTGEFTNAVPFPDVLAVDVAVAPGAAYVGMVAAGSGTLVTAIPEAGCTWTFCAYPALGSEGGFSEPTSVAYDAKGQPWVVTREPALRLASSPGVAIPLPGAPRQHTGHRIFHIDSGGGIACASCHPEAREDGRVWNFFPVGPRRTMSVSGGILSRAPYHWSGDEPTLGALMDDVFVHRMNGGQTSDAQNQLVGQWLDGLPFPAPPPVSDAAAVSRGQAIFTNPAVGCATCHAGLLFTDDAVVDVGTGGRFKVPALKGLWARAPYLHAGCAGTLADRFAGCATPQHGNIAGLNAQNISDLIAYLETL